MLTPCEMILCQLTQTSESRSNFAFAVSSRPRTFDGRQSSNLGTDAAAECVKCASGARAAQVTALSGWAMTSDKR